MPKKMKISSPRARKNTGLSKQTNVPVAYAYKAPKPRFESKVPITSGASARYVGCDYVGAINSSSAAVNNGTNSLAAFTASVFPRLSAIADVFLRYRYRSLKFHLIGRSASTQAGTGAFASFVLDGATSTITVNTEAIIKNAEGALVLKGWESGVHTVDVEAAGPKWYNCDADSVPFTPGALVQYIPQTTANNDLSWDLYVEYDVEFAEAVVGATVTPLFKERRDRKVQAFLDSFKKDHREVPDIEDLDKEIALLRKKMYDLESKKTLQS